MASHLQTPEGFIYFTEIEEWHKDQLKLMHEELFPVKYSKKFYELAVQKTGLRGGELFTSIAFQEKKNINGEKVQEMVGFVMSQFLSIHNCEERSELFDNTGEPREVYYILTLGVDMKMRRTGLGTELLRQCMAHAHTNPTCGAVRSCPYTYNTLTNTDNVTLLTRHNIDFL